MSSLIATPLAWATCQASLTTPSLTSMAQRRPMDAIARPAASRPSSPAANLRAGPCAVPWVGRRGRTKAYRFDSSAPNSSGGAGWCHTA